MEMQPPTHLCFLQSCLMFAGGCTLMYVTSLVSPGAGTLGSWAPMVHGLHSSSWCSALGAHTCTQIRGLSPRDVVRNGV